LTAFLLTISIVVLGALLQAATGLGAGLIVVPLLAMVNLQLVPGPMIFASLALSTVMAYRGRADIAYANVHLLLAGVVLGTVAAAAMLTRLPPEDLGLVFGGFILAAVAISIRSPSIPQVPAGMLGAGTLSGFMGTSAGIGAPVLALLYQHQSGPTIRATLALLYLFSSVVMLLALHLAGRFGDAEFRSGLLLMPGFLLGYLVSLRIVRHVDKGYARTAVVVISTLSALVLIWRSL